MTPTKIALLGAGFIADIHLESYHRFIPEAQVVAIYTRNPDRAKTLAAKYHVPQTFTDLEKCIRESNCDVVDVCLPNFLHARAVKAAAAAGKHVIIEKPLCLTLEEADDMIAACKSAGKLLLYAEELCFAPKYERVRSLVKEGAVGDIYMLKQSEKHSGPHSDWFYDINQSGGGVLMDMGCHALAWFRWMLGNPKPKSATAFMQTVYHKGRTQGEDNSVVIIEFENNVIGVAENSWARHGGMDDRAEVHGTGGVSYADLFQGNSALTYSLKGYGYAAEKAGSTQGWTFTMFEEAFNQGYPQELRHFIVDCVRNGGKPVVTGEDGKAVLELMYAAYAAAGTGQKISFPFHPKVARPVDLWLNK
jgi:myo-inositol 2-dehydrogenase/D-chiro-inositol 1-dehydrogenase